MIWREPRDHCTDCYFCLGKTSGYNKKNKYKIEYPNLPSAIRPVTHSAEIPVSVFAQLPSFDDLDLDEELDDSHDTDFEIEDDSVHKGFNQNELK